MGTEYIAISGGFDPLHSGHLDYIEAASKYGKIIVFLNSDEWLVRKKGYVFMKWATRARILKKFPEIEYVILAKDDSGSVCESLEEYRHQIKYFGNGGDRHSENTPEETICRLYGIKNLYGLGGSKTDSSSDLVRNVQKI